MKKLLEILKEVFGLLRSIVVALGEIAGPLLRWTFAGAAKVWAFVAKHTGPTARAVWSVLCPALRKAAAPFAPLGSRVWRAVGPWIGKAGRLLLKFLSIGVRSAWRAAAMTPVLSSRDRALMVGTVGEMKPVWLVRTGTKVDVGIWFRKRRVWACLTENSLVLFAGGKTPLVTRIDVGELKKTRYNHITGELILSPAENAPIRCLRMPPLDGFELLSLIRDDADVESWSISLDEHLDVLERAKDGGPVVETLRQSRLQAT